MPSTVSAATKVHSLVPAMRYLKPTFVDSAFRIEPWRVAEVGQISYVSLGTGVTEALVTRILKSFSVNLPLLSVALKWKVCSPSANALVSTSSKFTFRVERSFSSS